MSKKSKKITTKKIKKLSFKSALTWLDEHILLLLTGFLMAFIPLYPKIPLFDAVPGYIVRVRLEDIFVLLSAVIWLIQVIRKKIKWNTVMFWLIATYAAIGLLSVFSAAFLIRTIPLETIHLAKSFLHYFRYLEYFSLFIISFSAVRKKEDVSKLITIFSLTVIAITLYGYGQKYYYWPVFSTMNREFSKGMVLYLTEHARVQSTFAGHYDLAAYLVIALNLLLAFAYKQKQNLKKAYFHLVHLLGLWLLIMTASRTSFIAYLFGAFTVIFLIALEQKNLKKKIIWGLKQFTLLLSIVIFMMFSFGADMAERFMHVLEGYPQFVSAMNTVKTTQENVKKQTLIALGLKENEEGKLGQRPDNAISIDELERDVLTDTDERPTSKKPSDVYVDVPDPVKVATTAADGSTQIVIEQRERVWSDNALKYGLSTAIRLDTLWPNAINGFKKNPILGSGYATLNKESFYHFTEAESTDNNFLRILGETGLFGLISFFSIIVIAIYLAYSFYKTDKTYTSTVSIGFIGASMGLLLNATYIDVFAASKVAFTYWSLSGIVMALFFLDKHQDTLKKIKWFHQLRNKFCPLKKRNKK